MLWVNTHEAKTNLSKLLVSVEEGKDVVIARFGKPVAKLVVYKPVIKKVGWGLLKNKIWMDENFNDESLEVNEMFYGKK